jgi:hypothetical protein
MFYTEIKLPVSQFVPEKPGIQLQKYAFTLFKHVAPLTQGLDVHSSMSERICNQIYAYILYTY